MHTTWRGRPDEGPLTWDVAVRRATYYLVAGALAVLVVVDELKQWHGVSSVLTVALMVPALVGGVVARHLQHIRPERLSGVLIPVTILSVVVGVCSTSGMGGVLLFVPLSVAANRWPPRLSLALMAGSAGLYWVGWLVLHHGWGSPMLLLALAGSYLSGLLDRAYYQRVAQTAELLRQTERTRVAEARSAALAERTRIAREMHDVLAHSLAGLTVQLNAADALLDSDEGDQAREVVRRCQRMAREGLAETKQAVLALREGGADRPLPDELRALLADADAQAPGMVVDGAERPVPAEAGFALYRIAQEALTNAVKHAPGAAVTVRLSYQPDRVELVVANGTAAGPTPATGSGYGLIGMAERVEPLGGTVVAGPVDDGWRVTARIPV